MFVLVRSVILIPISGLLRYLRASGGFAHDDTIHAEDRHGGLCREAKGPRLRCERIKDFIRCRVECAVGLSLRSSISVCLINIEK